MLNTLEKSTSKSYFSSGQAFFKHSQKKMWNGKFGERERTQGYDEIWTFCSTNFHFLFMHYFSTQPDDRAHFTIHPNHQTLFTPTFCRYHAMCHIPHHTTHSIHQPQHVIIYINFQFYWEKYHGHFYFLENPDQNHPYICIPNAVCLHACNTKTNFHEMNGGNNNLSISLHFFSV